MHVQIEVTTRCNYECFYCAGRQMPQRHMDMELFHGIMSRLPPGGHRVSLQGEGEPLMHPNFWEMVQTVTEAGHMPYTITNGSLLKPDLVRKYFPRIGVSIDTVDPQEAQRIRRYKLERMLGKLDELLAIYEPHRVIVHTVNYGQDMQPLKAYLVRVGITKHVVQALQPKDDYVHLYKDIAALKPARPVTYSCEFLNKPVMRFYNIDGVEMPCCYIKDTTHYGSIAELKRQLDAKIVPPPCSGCQELQEGVEMSRVFLV